MTPRPAPARPASPDPLVAAADRCVQCGLCLPACPTYAHGRLEAEGPRGRIALIRAWALDAATPTPAGDAHLDHCLGCRRCEAACPAGVPYGALLVQTRQRQRGRRGAGLLQRALEAAVRWPRGLRIGLSLYRSLYALLPRSLQPLPRPPRRPPPAPAAAGAMTVALFRGCVADTYEAPLRNAIARLCAAVDVRCIEPRGQACCGAVHAHAGDIAAAGRLASRNRAAFEGTDTVLVAASGCHGTVAETLGAARVADPLTLLDTRASALRFRPTTEQVALHLPCTQRSVVRSEAALRRLLARVPGLRVVELRGGYGCCGAAGTRMLTDPAAAAAYRAPLLEEIAASGASRVLSANIGCRLHLGPATRVPIEHPLEFLARHLA